MNAVASKRSRFQGMWQVVRFNPAFYVASLITLILSGAIIARLPAGLQVFALFLWGLACWWVFASLLASHWVYDLSEWPHGTWLKLALMNPQPNRVLNVHSGFDETTLWLRQWLPKTEVLALDLFDAQRLTERSIHRARSFLPPLPDTLSGSPEQWPQKAAPADVVFFLLSAHEFRLHGERVRLLKRAMECLSDHTASCVILVEHVRDPANAIAFGPGFVHFHSIATWQKAWQEAGLQPTLHFRITPFVCLWRLQPAPVSRS